MRAVSFLAIKDLKRDRKIALLVVFLIAFSYINITFFGAFINGLGNTFQESVINTATSHVILTPSETSELKYIPSISSIRKKIELNPDVVASAPHVSAPVSISFGSKEFPISITGLQPSDEVQVTTIPSYVVDGSFLTDNSNSDIVLGRLIAGQRIEDTIGQQQFGEIVTGLGVRVGEVVTVKYANGITKEYRVRGIVHQEGFSQVSQGAYITMNEAESVLGLQDEASSVLVKLDDKYNADAVKTFILEQGVRNVDVRTWAEASSFVGAINSTFGIVTFATSLVGVMIVIVTIGIVIFINTSRKKRIIGVLKAIGMSSHEVMMIFVMQSVLLGAAGTLVGVAAFSAMNYYTAANPISLPIGELRLVLGTDAVVGAAILIIISSLIAGYVPARMASRQKILETIKTVE